MSDFAQSNLVHCFDLSLPEHTRFAAWSDEGEVRVVTSANGRRVMVFATPGALVFTLGFPVPLPDDPQALRDWYATHPMGQPTWFRADVDGRVERAPGDSPIPRAALQDPGVRELRALWRRSARAIADLDAQPQKKTDPHADHTEPRLTEDSTRSQESPSISEPVLGTLSLEPIEGARPMVLAVTPGHVALEADAAGGMRVRAEAGASFVVAHVPDTSVDLHEWFKTTPFARATGYRVDEQAQVVVDPWALELLADRISTNPESEAALLWQPVLSASESARVLGLRSVAVSSVDVARFVAEQARAPRALIGKTGILYAPIAPPLPADALPQVRGVPPDGAPAHVVRVDLNSEEGLQAALYAPVGGRYFLISPGGAHADGDVIPEQTEAILVRGGGERLPLPATERTRLWAEAVPFDLVRIRPLKHRQKRQLSREVDHPSVDGGSALPATDKPPVDLWPDELTPSEPDLEDLRAIGDSEVVRSFVSAGEDHEGSEREAIESEALSRVIRWRFPFEGHLNIHNWQKRSPVGELWVAELLHVVVDHIEELDAAGCLVPLQLLRQGYSLTRTDRECIQRALEVYFADRLATVRVFDLDGQTYFARQTAQGLRLVGPRCAPVRSETVRRQIASSYGLDGDAQFVDIRPPEPSLLGRSRSRDHYRPSAGQSRRL